jgi:hypothetical protein
MNSHVRNPQLKIEGKEPIILIRVKDQKEIKSGTWYSDKNETILCIDLVKGESKLVF